MPTTISSGIAPSYDRFSRPHFGLAYFQSAFKLVRGLKKRQVQVAVELRGFPRDLDAAELLRMCIYGEKREREWAARRFAAHDLGTAGDRAPTGDVGEERDRSDGEGEMNTTRRSAGLGLHPDASEEACSPRETPREAPETAPETTR